MPRAHLTPIPSALEPTTPIPSACTGSFGVCVALAGSLRLVHHLGHVDLAQLTRAKLDEYNWAVDVRLAFEQPDFTHTDVKALVAVALEFRSSGRGAGRTREKPARWVSEVAVVSDKVVSDKRRQRKRGAVVVVDDDDAEERPKQRRVRRALPPSRLDWRKEPDELKQAAMRCFGYADVHTFQRPVIEAVLKKQDAVVAQPTAGGKSLCFQAPVLFDALRVTKHLAAKAAAAAAEEEEAAAAAAAEAAAAAAAEAAEAAEAAAAMEIAQAGRHKPGGSRQRRRPETHYQ